MTLTGCQFADEACDIEMARGEARYVPVELIGTGLGVMRADGGTYSSVVHQSYSAGDPITSMAAPASLVDGMGTDGEGTVFCDFALARTVRVRCRSPSASSLATRLATRTFLVMAGRTAMVTASPTVCLPAARTWTSTPV